MRRRAVAPRLGLVAFDLDDFDWAVVDCLLDVFVERLEVRGGVRLDDAVLVVFDGEDLWRDVLAELA